MAAAQDELCKMTEVLGKEIDGERLDMGTPLGYLQTQAALALHSVFASDFSAFVKRLM